MNIVFDDQRAAGDAVFDSQLSSGGTAIDALVGNAAAAGAAASILQGVVIAAGIGAAAAAGALAAIVSGQTISASVGNAAAAGATAAITSGGSQTITAAVGNAVAAGPLTTIGHGVLLQASTGAAVAAGAAATITSSNLVLALQPGRRVVAKATATLVTLDAMDVEESDVIAFEFEKALPPGVTLNDAVLTVDRRAGSESAPGNFLVGSRQISVNGLQVLQQVDASLISAGNYAVRCKATRSDGLHEVAVALVAVSRL